MNSLPIFDSKVEVCYSVEDHPYTGRSMTGLVVEDPEYVSGALLGTLYRYTISSRPEGGYDLLNSFWFNTTPREYCDTMNQAARKLDEKIAAAMNEYSSEVDAYYTLVRARNDELLKKDE